MLQASFLRPSLYALGLLLGGLGVRLPAQAPAAVAAPAAAEDGPHVFWEGEQARIYWVRKGGVEVEAARGKVVLPLTGLAARPLVLTPQMPAPAQGEFPAPEKILALSDVHGRFDTLLKLLKVHKVVDDTLQWTFGLGHLVILGDVMDRGPRVTEALWFLRALQEAALEKGGRVHVLPGNHEAMVAAGDLRYLHPKYARHLEGLPTQPELVGPNSELGRWLRSLPVLLKLGDYLFVHGGISPELVAQGWTLEQINARFRGLWGGYGSDRGGEKELLLRSKGPIWYRGLVQTERGGAATEAEVLQALQRFQVKAIVVGHTTLDRVTALHGGKVFGVDAGILEGRPGEVWLWQEGRVWRGGAEGGREPLIP